MAKMLYGGFDATEAPIDMDDDPEPLLAEIARCALEGVPLRPQLAHWLVSAWKDKRLLVTRRSGRPKNEPTARVVQALRRIELLSADDLPDPNAPEKTLPPQRTLNEAVERVRKDMKLRVSRSALLAHRREIRVIDRE